MTIRCAQCIFWESNDPEDSFGICRELFNEVVCSTEDSGINATQIETPFDFGCILGAKRVIYE